MAHAVVDDQFVHATRSQGGANGVDDRHAGIDVADQLRLSLAGVRALFQQDNWWLLRQQIKRISIEPHMHLSSQGFSCSWTLREQH